MIYHDDDDYQKQFQLQQYNYSNRDTHDSITPLSMMLESDTLLDDHDISSYRFNEEDYLSSIISSESSINPLRRRPVSFTSPSPLQQQRLEQEPIVGSPFVLDAIEDPIIERRFSVSDQKPNLKPSSKFASFLSKMKKAASGKQSLFNK
jgi:hypothetical protein